MKKFLLVITAFVFILTGVSLANAASYDLALRLTPSVIDEPMPAGETTTKVVNITNTTDENLPITAYVKLFNASDEVGNMDFSVVNNDQSSPINWIKIKKDKFILKPNEFAAVSVEFTPPKDIPPGGYYAVLFFESVLTPTDQASKVQVGGQVGALLFITIPGDIKTEGKIIEAQTSPWHFFRTPMPINIRLANTGNVHLRPSGTITLKNYPFFAQSSTPIEQFTVLPQKIRKTQTTPAIKWPGVYKADITLRLANDMTVKYDSIYFLYLSWPWLVAIVIIVCGIIIVSSRRRLTNTSRALSVLFGRSKKVI